MTDDDVMTTERAFEKHTTLAEIFAVEWLIAPGFSREAVGAIRCTKPEQLTRGALPVLLINSTDLDFYKRNCLEFTKWEPPMVDEDAMQAIFAAETYCQETQAEAERCVKAASVARKLHDQACDDLRRIVREANTDQPVLPLLALAELPDAQEIPDDRPIDDGPADDGSRHPD